MLNPFIFFIIILEVKKIYVSLHPKSTSNKCNI